MVPSKGGAPKGGAPKGGPRKGGGPKGGGPKISLFFFPLLRHNFHSSFSLGGSFCGSWVV